MAKGRIYLRSAGNFDKTLKFLKNCQRDDIYKSLDKYGERGVEALRAATPVDTGLTADSWTYKITFKSRRNVTISWYNTNYKEGYCVALLIQHGHGTRDGKYVKGRDFINPAIKPIFDAMADEVWNEVIKS